MMTLTEFIAAHNGKYLDYDGYYGAQCVDLIDFYCRDVLGIPVVWADAVRWFGQDNAYLDWVRNTPDNQPPVGAIVVWGQNFKVGTGVNGHIAIAFRNITPQSFDGFDQNFPPNLPCHIQYHTYDGVIGWGIPKTNSPQGGTTVPPDQMPAGWSDWEKLPGFAKQMSVIQFIPGRVDIFIIGQDDAIYHTYWPK